MKTIKIVLFACILVTSTTACFKRNRWGIKGQGSNATETRNAKNFDRIDLSIEADVNYTQDSVFLVEVNAQPNILEVVTTDVANGELNICTKRELWDHNRIRITVHSPDLHGVSISGSGNIMVQNSLNTNNISLNISGSGNIGVPSITATAITAKVSGSGNVDLRGGITKSEDFLISGSGNMNADYLFTSFNTSKISGSGSLSVNVSEQLDVIISGSGDVRYRGKPAITTSISGSGRLIHLN
jgi:hypothetical protein